MQTSEDFLIASQLVKIAFLKFDSQFQLALKIGFNTPTHAVNSYNFSRIQRDVCIKVVSCSRLLFQLRAKTSFTGRPHEVCTTTEPLMCFRCPCTKYRHIISMICSNTGRPLSVSWRSSSLRKLAVHEHVIRNEAGF